MLDTHLEYKKAHLKQVLECEFHQLTVSVHEKYVGMHLDIEIRGVHIEYLGN